MDSPVFYAHKSEDGTRWQTLFSHLKNTADLAASFAAPFHGEEEAYLAGMLHDIGKYSAAFQRRLNGSPERVDHSTAGALEARRLRRIAVAFAVAGHHGGLPDLGGRMDHLSSTTLWGRFKRKVEPYDPWKLEVPLPQKGPLPNPIPQDGFSTSFYIRMLYSCLVDADYLDTEAFMDGTARADEYDSIPVLCRRLEEHIASWERPDTELNRRRDEILQACLRSGGSGARGLYTLTVPTGGGKTLSSLAFALSMARSQDMARVIYVIPYTSIIDQNAAVFARILGEKNVLEHHSGVEYALTEDASPGDRRKALAVENWDAPIVVTTAVQFFESLFASRSSRCRKLHNIANSVIIFDEAQSLPVPELKPCVSAIAQLVQHYGATAVLCTATQPALGPLFRQAAPDLMLREICPDPAGQYLFFRRTVLNDLGVLAEDQLIQRLNGAPQVLCVVNRRSTAQMLYAGLEADGAYCLTTLLCPADRKRLLAEIRSRLKAGLPCRVVSTSLIEAGVDVDFPAAYRELTGLDSILQTAGRCNREGTHSAEESPVCLFRLEGQKEPKMLEKNVDAAMHTLREFPDPSAPDAIEHYFTFFRSLTGEDLMDHSHALARFCAQEYSFTSVARDFHLINQESRPVYIPIGEGAAYVDRLRKGERGRTLLRRLGQYGVSVYPFQLKELERTGVIEWLDEEIAVLTDLRAYNPRMGLAMEVETGEGIFI